MIDWTLSNPATGEIIATGTANTAEQANAQATGGGVITLVYSDPPVEQVSGGVVVPRPAGSTVASKLTFTADGVDYVRFTPIAAGATVTIIVPVDKGIEPIAPNQTITGGLVDINTTIPGKYTVTISRFPDQDYTVELNAV
jgi:hypothetical protein